MQLIDNFKERGVILRADGDVLRVKGILTEDDRGLIRKYKKEILTALSSPEAGGDLISCPVNPDPGLLTKRKNISQGERTWMAWNHFRCACGDLTGWRRDGQPCCPLCEYEKGMSDDLRKRMLAHAGDLERVASVTTENGKQASRRAVAAAIRKEFAGSI
jgi:hypothetical protein